jgi:hypothetical protein
MPVKLCWGSSKFGLKNQEDHHYFEGMEIQAVHSPSNLYIFEIDNAAYYDDFSSFYQFHWENAGRQLIVAGKHLLWRKSETPAKKNEFIQYSDKGFKIQTRPGRHLQSAWLGFHWHRDARDDPLAHCQPSLGGDLNGCSNEIGSIFIVDHCNQFISVAVCSDSSVPNSQNFSSSGESSARLMASSKVPLFILTQLLLLKPVLLLSLPGSAVFVNVCNKIMSKPVTCAGAFTVTTKTIKLLWLSVAVIAN